MYISIVCPISRKGAEELILKNLRNVIYDDIEYEFVFIIDNKQVNSFKLQLELEKLKPRNLSILKTGKQPPPVYSMNQRRTRIADNHNKIKEALGSSQFVFGFEDDTVLPKTALAQLVLDYKQADNPGFIEGVQVGRWNRPYIGAWHYEPDKFTSLKPGKGLEPIDAGGFYCFLTPTSLYKEHEFKWDEPLGPDVEYSLSLRKQGYQNYIDWDVETEHLQNGEALKLNKKVQQIIIKNEGRWSYEYK